MFTPSVMYSKLAQLSMPNRYQFNGLMSGPAGMQPQLLGRIQHTTPSADAPNFQTTLANMAQDVNKVVRAPNDLMVDAMTGGKVDIHQVMLANAKAELAISMTSQVATKVVQAYDRITQIQV